MTLKEFKSNVDELLKLNPWLADKEVIFSGDDEGNHYGKVIFGPTPGNFDDGEFHDYKHLAEGTEVNSICIN